MKNVKLANNALPSLDPQRGQRSFALGADHALDYHPLANLFPLIEGADFDALVASVAEHGLRDPIWIFEGKILDGRNRYRAARQAGVPLRFKLFQGDDAVQFVLDLNLQRRHLSESQRSYIGAKLADLPQGGQYKWKAGDEGLFDVANRTGKFAGSSEPASPQNVGGMTQAAAAETMHVSERSVRSAAKVLRDGAPELQAAVERDAISVTAAEAVSELTPDEQRRVLDAGDRAVLDKAKEIRARKAELRRAERMDKIRASAEPTRIGKSPCLYPVIYLDPPWRYENPPMGDTDRSIENHYETMPLAEIAALPVGEWATGDAVLYLWCTVPQLFFCVPPLMAAWGFTVKSQIVWDKQTIALGSWARNRHEILLICTRGKMPPPPPALVPESVYAERAERHSAKPDHFRKMIEAQYPDLPRLEMFARHRGQRDLGGGFYAADAGWHVWGNQARAHGEATMRASEHAPALPLAAIPQTQIVAPAETPAYVGSPAASGNANTDDLDIPEFLRRNTTEAA